MPLSLDIVVLGVSDTDAARNFYTGVFAPQAVERDCDVGLDMHGTGELGLHRFGALAVDAGAKPDTAGFRGYVISCIVDQPSQVQALLHAAVERGATVLKPAKKSLFGGFSAVCQAPDGAIWKLASANRKDARSAAEPPVPRETGVLLGVAEPKVSKAFYEALDMSLDRDYGDKYIDFSPAPGACRLCLMQRKVLAKDAGIGPDGDGFGAAILDRRAGSREEVDAVLAAAESAGGQVAVAPREVDRDGYSGHFADPDGFLWKVAVAG